MVKVDTQCPYHDHVCSRRIVAVDVEQKDEVVAQRREGLDCSCIMLRCSLKIVVSSGRSEEKPGPQIRRTVCRARMLR
jgi:hypothetical protein